MASVNKVILLGNLGRDPELRTFPSGDQVAGVNIATTDRWRDKNTGENRESTEWHRVSFHGKLAEIVGQYLRKGAQVYVEGSLHTRKWTDQATGQDRYATEVRADVLQMLGKPAGSESGSGGRAAPAASGSAPAAQRAASGFDEMDDDMPFADPMRKSLGLWVAC